MEDFWLNNYNILFNNNNYKIFIPNNNMTINEKLNATARFSIYLILLLLILNAHHNLLYFPILLLLGSVIIYHYNHNNSEQVVKSDLTEKFQSTCPYPDFIYGINKSALGKNKGEIFDDFSSNPVDSYYESIDFTKNNDDISSKCRTPTNNNPFMNPLLNEYTSDNSNIPHACNVEDDQINNDMNVGFNYNLFRNMNDVFDKSNSQRQFFSVPSNSIPNNQRAFADWCFNNNSTCKDDQSKCLRYEDIRFNSQFDPTERD